MGVTLPAAVMGGNAPAAGSPGDALPLLSGAVAPWTGLAAALHGPPGRPPWAGTPGPPEHAPGPPGHAPGPPPWAGPPDREPEPPAGNPWLDERRVANIAHAGGIFEAPQNTLFAFETAEARGADVIEMDLHATADGHVVAIHDSTVDRTTDGQGCVVAHTLAEIQQLDAAYTHVPGQNPEAGLDDDAYPYRGVAAGTQSPPEGFAPTDFTVPTLEEIFTALPDALMVLEIKPTEVETRRGQVHDCPAILDAMPADQRPDPVAEVARLIDEHDMAGQVIVASFIDEIMQRFVTLAPEVDTSFPLGEGLAFYAAWQQGREPENPHGHVAIQSPISIGNIEVSEEFIAFAQDQGVAMHFWTINDEAEMELLLDWGADGIITDRVQVLDQLLDARGEPRP